ncbi:metallo-mystery pair system four-Cys motif protein [Thalassomonas viridans]|uniref:Metallo-mystery pair system four-Cys motif protein n=1 Tax=Thalassomonas viridans TaxID=137584 RepID=A0AAE9Z6J3_9GAMM|nr:MbnP family copper-binding protein [Thalassomonas viridans]WDE06188.1 metallo-mystery pair system four-Cys motif protein [Thalassomonas viridans]
MTDLKLFFSRLFKITASFSVFFSLAACDKKPPPAIAVKPVYQQQLLGCNEFFSHGGESWRYRQLQFFISDVQVTTQAGGGELNTASGQEKHAWQTLPLLENRFQSNQLALLGESCADNQPGQGNWQLQPDPAFDLSGVTRIRFSLGVPFALNHLNPLTQASPLNVPSMFWVWRTGHKFLRLEMASDRDNWLFHLGSTGCAAPSPVRAPAQECRQPNRFQFEFALNGDKPELVLDLSALLTQVALTQDTSCQSAQDNPHCQQLLANLDKSRLFRGGQ